MDAYGQAIDRVKRGEDACSLSVKLMVALLKVQYAEKLPCNARRAAVVDKMAAALAKTPLNFALAVESLGDSDSEEEEEEEGEEEEEEEM